MFGRYFDDFEQVFVPSGIVHLEVTFTAIAWTFNLDIECSIRKKEHH